MRGTAALGLAFLLASAFVAPAAAGTDVEADARAVILAALPGETLDPASADHLAAGGRGLILFRANLTSAARLRRLAVDAACAANAPLLIAADHEAGRVARLRPVGVARIEADLPTEALAAAAGAAAREMRAAGVNFALAPVADVAAGSSPALRGRTLGSTPERVAEAAAAFIAGMQAYRIVTAAKHFPGLGRAAADPHDGAAGVAAPAADLEAVDLAPFRAAIAAGVRAVMVGHATYRALDPDRPASLSPSVLGVLRDDLAFSGVAVSDALGMGALRGHGSIGEVAVASLHAGVDLLIVEDAADVGRVVDAIVTAVSAGDLDRARVAEAAARVRHLAAWASPTRCRPIAPAVR